MLSSRRKLTHRVNFILSIGMSTTTASSLTTAARENVVLDSGFTDGLPGKSRTSIYGWGGLRWHPNVQLEEDDDQDHFGLSSQVIAPQRIVTPSLATSGPWLLGSTLKTSTFHCFGTLYHANKGKSL
jgi:hypothetical protein